MKESQRNRGPSVQQHRMAVRQEKVKVREGRRGNSQILMVTYSITIIFLCMAGYLVYFMVTQSQEVINNPYNKRQEVLAKKVQKGQILSADGKVLAKTVTDEKGNDTRVYPYNDIFCHIVGRDTNSMTGIEGRQCYPLLTSHVNPLEKLTNTFQEKKVREIMWLLLWMPICKKRHMMHLEEERGQ